jgi:hypothetical protein
MRTLTGYVAGIAFGVAFIVACSPGPGLIDMLDGGTSGADGGLLDIGHANADAAPAASPVTMMSACDKISTVTTGATSTQYYFAEFTIPGLTRTSAPNITATGCDLRKLPDNTPYEQFTCNGDPNCHMSGYQVPTGQCVTGYGGSVSKDKFIVSCGQSPGLTAQTVYIQIN